MTKEKIKKTIGWKEWCSLDCIALPAIKGKVDTGAKTSAIHAFNIECFFIEDVEYVKFDIHPLQKNKKLKRSCIARIIERRMVSDSSGKKARIELTLANRDSMAFRMLIGRETLHQLKTIVDVSKSFLQGKKKRKEILKAYRETKSPQFEII